MESFELQYFTVPLRKWLEGVGCPTLPSAGASGFREAAPRPHSARFARVATAS